MDRSVPLSPDPVPGYPPGERRRSVRQKLHTPVYASFNGPQTGMVVDLSELLDLHEDGFAVQTSERLQKDRSVTICLDLPETGAYIHGSGQVVWSDDAGRSGIRFSALPDGSKKILKEWLFTNLLIACSNRAARSEQLARREEERLTESVPMKASSTAISIVGGSGTLAPLDAVRGAVQDAGDDVDAVLQLITERALTLTGASGAALAYLTDDKMICRARTGEPAPPLGAALHTGEGLTGECVRSGRLVSCGDTDNDPRVDPDLCRALGIGSLLAAPIVSEFCVVGVLEVFSPHARAFTYAHAVLLDQIVGIVPRIQGDTQPENTQSATPIEPDDVPVVLPPVESRLHSMAAASSEEPIEEKIEQKTKGNTEQENDPNTEVREQVLQVQVRNLEPESPTPPRLLYRALLGLAIAVAVTALGYVVGPAMKNWIHTPQVAQGSFVKAVKAAETTSPVSGQITGNRGPTGLSSATAKVSSINPRSPDPSPQPKSLPDLRKRADAGDADAQWLMGVRYHDGEGVPRDDGQAVQWFQRAAEQGNVAAQGALGAYFWRGRGVPEDLSKAYFWSDIAMAQGDELSKSRIEGLSSQMTSNQVAAARQRAEVWIRAHNQPAKSTGN